MLNLPVGALPYVRPAVEHEVEFKRCGVQESRRPHLPGARVFLSTARRADGVGRYQLPAGTAVSLRVRLADVLRLVMPYDHDLEWDVLDPVTKVSLPRSGRQFRYAAASTAAAILSNSAGLT